jgi:hypothetical protein
VFLKRNSLVALCVWLALVQGCEPRVTPSSDLTIEHEVSPQPPRVGQVTITFKLTGASGQPVTGAVVKLEGNMSHAGMVPVFGEAKEIEAGRYRSTLELSMAGDWFVLVTGTLADKGEFERQVEIKGVAP